MVMSAGGHIGSMPHWLVVKNMTLFAEEVMPHFREADGKPVWARAEPPIAGTVAERSATVPKPAHRPKARLDDSGAYVDGVTGWIAEQVDRLDGMREEVRDL
jgi:hypothetical protein